MTSVAVLRQCRFEWVQVKKGEGYFRFQVSPGCSVPRLANQRTDVRIVDHDGRILKKEKTT